MIISTKSKVQAMGTTFSQPTQIQQKESFELMFYDICGNIFGKDLGNLIFENWSRFLDDCETLLEENKINLHDSLSILNSIDLSIQFKMEYSKAVIPFLEILIKCTNDKIWMDIYYKQTDTHRCLPFSSIQFNHCKKNIIFTLVRRICTNYCKH